jgi:hypothetical protein
MKNQTLKIAAIMLFVSISCLVAQNQPKTKNQSQVKKEAAKKSYTFKTMKEKEKTVWLAYKKLTRNINDQSYPKDVLKVEKRELICLITAEVLDERAS